MPRVQAKIPISVDLSDAELDALGKVARVVKVARESGLMGLMRDMVVALDTADKRAKPRRRPRVGR